MSIKNPIIFRRQCGKVRATQQTLKLLVDELFSDEIYVFRVVAVNDVGRGVSLLFIV